MKTKNFTKKLILNKTTVSNLEKMQMNDIRGGWTLNTCAYTCPECDTYRTCGYCPVINTEDPTCLPGMC